MSSQHIHTCNADKVVPYLGMKLLSRVHKLHLQTFFSVKLNLLFRDNSYTQVDLQRIKENISVLRYVVLSFREVSLKFIFKNYYLCMYISEWDKWHSNKLGEAS
jgi:hypothetical protein